MAIPQMFNPIKPPIQMGVVWALWQKVTPQTVKTTGEAIKKQEVAKAQAAKSAPMEFSQKEIAFLKQVKAQGMDKNEALAYIQSKRQPQAPVSNVKNVWEWMISFAWWLPKVIAETGILDNAVQRLSEWKIWQAVRSWAEKIFWAEALQQYKQQNLWKTFSQVAWWSQVGGDPESKVAKRVETTMDIAWAVWWLAAAAKWLSKRAAKKWIEEVVSAKGTQRQMEEAIAEWRVKPWATGIRKFLFGSKPQVIDKQSIQNAAGTISREIKNPAYKQPTKLFSQIDDLIETKAKSVAKDLKTLNIWSFTKDKAKTYKLIQNGIIDNDAVNKLMTPKEIKSLKTAIDWIKKAKTADDLWTARKALDLATPDSVKRASSISSDILQYRNSLWKQARSEINDLIEASAEKYGKEWVKDIFKTMSELYQAQYNILSKAGKIVKETTWLLSKQNIKKAAVWTATIYWWNKVLDALWWQ